MSFESLINSALKEGAGVSLKKVQKSASYRAKLDRNRELAERHGPKTHRGIAFRVGVALFGGLMSLENEKAALRNTRDLSRLPSDEHLERDAQIQELGERLIDAAAVRLDPSSLEAAEAYRGCKDVSIQIALLRGQVTNFRTKADERRKSGEDDKKDASPAVPVGYGWVDLIFTETKPDTYLPHRFSKLGPKEIPNCLGMTILMAAWARSLGTRYLFASEIVGQTRAYYRYQLGVYDVLLKSLRGVKGKHAKNLRRLCRKEIKDLKGWQGYPRDWHHGIALELADGRWFYMDPFSKIARVFPSRWEMAEVMRRLSKYGEVLPGLSVTAGDHGVQERDFEVRFYALLEALATAEAVRYKLSEDLGKGTTVGDVLAAAPELNYLCDMFVEDTSKWPRPVQEPFKRLVWLLLCWRYDTNGKEKGRPAKKIRRDIKRFKVSKKFRRRKLNFLMGQFYWQALRRAKDYSLQIHSVLEFGNPAYSIGLTVLSNLASFTNDQGAGRLLLEHGNSQMLWHDAISPIPDFSALAPDDRELIKLGAHVISGLPQHPLTKLKLKAVKKQLKLSTNTKEE